MGLVTFAQGEFGLQVGGHLGTTNILQKGSIDLSLCCLSVGRGSSGFSNLGVEEVIRLLLFLAGEKLIIDSVHIYTGH